MLIVVHRSYCCSVVTVPTLQQCSAPNVWQLYHGAPLGDCPAASLGAEMKVSGPALASRGSECAFETRDKRARRDSARPKCLASTRHDGQRVDLAWMGTRRSILGRSHPRRPAPAIGWSRWRGGGGRLRRTPMIWCPSLPVRKRRAAFIVVQSRLTIKKTEKMTRPSFLAPSLS